MVQTEGEWWVRADQQMAEVRENWRSRTFAQHYGTSARFHDIVRLDNFFVVALRTNTIQSWENYLGVRIHIQEAFHLEDVGYKIPEGMLLDDSLKDYLNDKPDSILQGWMIAIINTPHVGKGVGKKAELLAHVNGLLLEGPRRRAGNHKQPMVVGENETFDRTAEDIQVEGRMKKRIHPITDEEVKVYTFKEWLLESLQEVDDGVVVISETLARHRIMLNGHWHLATVYAPPPEIMSALVDQHPRDLQTEMFRRIIFAINSWNKLATDPHTGVVVPK